MVRRIAAVRALEILDSRGNPTVRVHVQLDNGITASASVPSGASTGENEALELRDGDKKRYGGKGVRKAVANVNDTVAPKLRGAHPSRQAEIDRLMRDLDGTVTKSKLGANAILGVSMAVARAAAMAAELPLYAYLGGTGAVRLPVPMMNILNGGKHADNSVDFQEFMVMPVGAPSFAEALRYGAETFHALKMILHDRKYATSVGDEGGFAPNLKSNEEACEVILEAIQAAGYTPGKDIVLALDPAASSFLEDGAYNLAKSGQGKKTSAQMTGLYKAWIEKYPIVSLEDGVVENDWDGFREHTAALGGKNQIVGDDLYVTNTEFISRGIREKSTNAVLIKLNQRVVAPSQPSDLTPYFGSGTLDNNGHTEWVEGDVRETGVTTTFTPNKFVAYNAGGTAHDIDFTSMRDGESLTLPTYAAITARSYHPGMVLAMMMDGSVRKVSSTIDVAVWRAMGTRGGGEAISSD